MKRFVLSITLLLVSFFVTTPAHAKDVNNFYFKSFSADYYITKDESGASHMRVVEKLVAVFPNYNQNLGIVRYIPFTNQGGANITVPNADALNISITRNGFQEPIYEITREDGYYQVSTGDDLHYLHGEQTFELNYDFNYVITDFKDHQELYWDTNGTGWRQRFEHLEARVHFLDGFDSLNGEVACYVGGYGSQKTCDYDVISDGYAFEYDKLAAGHNLSFAIGLKPGSFTTPLTYNLPFIVFGIASLVVFGLILALSIRYYLHVKDKKHFYQELFLSPQFQPAKGLSVAQAAGIRVKSSADSRVASLIELAVAHKITIIADQESKRKWRIKINTLGVLTPEQKTILAIINGGEAPEPGSTIELKKQGADSLIDYLNAEYAKQVERSLKRKKLLLENPRQTPAAKLSAAMFIISVAWIVVAFLALAANANVLHAGIILGGDIGIGFVVTLNLLIVLLPIIMSVRFSRYNKRSREGLEAARYYDGLELYMRMAEAERLKFLQSVKGTDRSPEGIVKLYEKLLPYAIIFGIENSWLAELNHYYETADLITPGWYSGVAIINTRSFNSFTDSTRSQITRSSSSSSSSGFSSGGGFSGGGGGGGGGGGR